MNRNIFKESGFALIELLIYIAIFAVIAGLITSILLIVTRVNQRESSSAEATSQLNFVMQRLQQLVRESSNIDISAGISTSTLKLRMKDQAKDPTCIYLSGGVIKLAEGPDATDPNNCTSITSNLTSDRVIVDAFNLQKFTQYPGHDTLSIDLQMTYNSTNPESRIQRTLESAIARVSAATFDSDILPGGGLNFNLGRSGAPWKDAYLSGVLNLGAYPNDPAVGQNGAIYYNYSSNQFRGYKNGAWSGLGEAYWNANGNNIFNTNSGNVGIGTTNPSAKLEVYGAPGDAIALNVVKTTATSFLTGPVFYLLDTNVYGILTGSGTHSGKSLFISRNLAVQSPFSTNITDSGSAIAVEDSFNQQASGNSVRSGNLLNITRETNIAWSGANVTVSGAVASFSDNCDVQAGGSCSSSADVLKLNQEYTANTGAALNITTAATDANALALRVNDDGTFTDSSPFVIDVFGNVGIATTTPNAKLEVNGNVMIDSGGLPNQVMCWKADGKTLGYCSSGVAADGRCTCN